jgi:hypothetical protein
MVNKNANGSDEDNEPIDIDMQSPDDSGNANDESIGEDVQELNPTQYRS